MGRQGVTQVSRRNLLKAAGISFVGAGLGTARIVRADEVRPAAEKPGARRVLRIAHMTDIHLQPERAADKGFAAALRHAQDLKDKPGLILTGGDTIMDSFGQDDARTTLQWNLFKSVMKQECSLPVKSCIGNHDTWGWNRKDSKTTGEEPLWGKRRAVHELGLPNRYYSFDRAGWHFIMLDSTHTDGADGYVAKLDEEQYEWLASDLAKTSAKTPVLLLSHQPILSAAAFLDGENEKTGNWQVPGAWMHIDVRRLKDLFKKHSNVKLSLSGHLHLVDRVDYCGVTYLCNGAVCAGWWKGDYQECDEGYGLIDLYDDGSFAHQYVAYNWTPVPEPGDEKK
jgi:3',5'-cyclic AMP phosphodiesterase CpdA